MIKSHLTKAHRVYEESCFPSSIILPANLLLWSCKIYQECRMKATEEVVTKHKSTAASFSRMNRLCKMGDWTTPRWRWRVQGLSGRLFSTCWNKVSYYYILPSCRIPPGTSPWSQDPWRLDDSYFSPSDSLSSCKLNPLNKTFSNPLFHNDNSDIFGVTWHRENIYKEELINYFDQKEYSF